MIYVASPFSHKDYLVQRERVIAVSLYTHNLIREGKIAFSPIAHCWPMYLYNDEVAGNFEYWAEFNIGMMKRARELRVLMLKDWRKSHGVRAEINWAEQNNLPIVYTPMPKGLLDENL